MNVKTIHDYSLINQVLFNEGTDFITKLYYTEFEKDIIKSVESNVTTTLDHCTEQSNAVQEGEF